MRVFITGATGFVGSVLVSELLGAGHQVVGLARSAASAAALRSAGADVHHGSLEDPDSLRTGASGADAVVHLAFIPDMARFAEAARIDEQAVVTIGTALKGSGRPFVVATGMGVVAGRVATVPESDSPPAARLAGPRAALRFVEHNVRATIVALPPITYGRGDTRGLLTRIIAVAREKNVSAFIGDGANRWPSVHILDAARLFRRALEGLPAGAAVHAVAGEGTPIRALAEEIGRHLGLPAASIAPADAVAHFGWLGRLLSRDVPASGAVARDLLGWEPTQPALLADLDEGHYFRSPTSGATRVVTSHS
jgi:nucleoside-diphosphate-sugar epimerase